MILFPLSLLTIWSKSYPSANPISSTSKSCLNPDLLINNYLWIVVPPIFIADIPVVEVIIKFYPLLSIASLIILERTDLPVPPYPNIWKWLLGLSNTN